MNFDLVRKNVAYKRFNLDVDRGMASHAYIVYGDDGDLRKTFFTLCAVKLLCKTACLECDTCTQIIEGNYVEYYFLDGANKITVKDVNALLDKLYVKPVVGDKKVVAIDNAQLLSVQVQNKLLKTYEEPPENLTFFLGANNENGLLATIRSRGKKLYLEDVTTEEIAEELISDGEDESTASVAAAFSMGNYEKAKKFCCEKGYREIYEKTFEMMTKLKKSSQVPEWVFSGLFDKDKISTTMDFMEIILCDVMKMVSGSSAPLYSVDRDYDLSVIADGFSDQSAGAGIFAINEGRKRLSSNVNVNCVATSVLMEILEAKYKWQKK